MNKRIYLRNTKPFFLVVWSWDTYQAGSSSSQGAVTTYFSCLPSSKLPPLTVTQTVALSLVAERLILIVFTVPSFLSQNRKTFWWYRAHCFGQSQTALFHWQRWTDVQIYLEFSTNIKTPHSRWFQGEGFLLNYQ